MIRVSLEKFKTDRSQSATAGIGDSETTQLESEDIRLSGFEDGYRAGWDDAQKLGDETQKNLTNELVQNIQEIGFVQEEARQHVLQAIEPVLTEMVSKVLPEAARLSLLPKIIENLTQLLEDKSQNPVTLLVAPEGQTAIEAALGDSFESSVNIEGDPIVAHNQARIVGQTVTIELDLDRAINEVQTILQDFFKLENGGQNDG